MMEPFCVALFRCLPKAHPIYKLLRPHLQTVCAINTDARNSLINPGSLANKAIALCKLFTIKLIVFQNLNNRNQNRNIICKCHYALLSLSMARQNNKIVFLNFKINCFSKFL